MPRTHLTNKYSDQRWPPIDVLRACVLERIAVRDLDLKALAEIGGVSYASMRQWIRKSPWDWPASLREKICRELGITPKRGVAGVNFDSEVRIDG